MAESVMFAAHVEFPVACVEERQRYTKGGSTEGLLPGTQGIVYVDDQDVLACLQCKSPRVRGESLD